MSSCCGDSDLASDSFADIIRGISRLLKAVAHEYMKISELERSDVFVLYLNLIIFVFTIVFTFKFILTWLFNSIGCLRRHTAQGGNTVIAISSSAEESNGHAPLDYLDCRSSC